MFPKVLYVSHDPPLCALTPAELRGSTGSPGSTYPGVPLCLKDKQPYRYMCPECLGPVAVHAYLVNHKLMCEHCWRAQRTTLAGSKVDYVSIVSQFMCEKAGLSTV